MNPILRLRKLALLILLLQPVYEVGSTACAAVAYPTGIYSSGGPTNAVNNSVDSRLNGVDFVDGALVRIGWNDIETSPGVYNWTRLDEQFARANTYNLNISLGLVNGMAYPTWLESEGAQTFSYLFRGTTAAKMPVPWDPVFLEHWTQFIGAAGERYGDSPALSLVHITTSSGNGFEMQLPSTPTDVANWNAIGYTVDRHVAAYEQVIDAFGAAFPNKALDLEVHPVLGGDAVAERSVAYANDELGNRFGVFAAWWSQKNADLVYPGMYQLLRDQGARTFASVQLVTNATNDPNGFGTGGIQAAVERAYADGIRYFEPWDVDLLNPAFANTFNELDAEIVASPIVGDYNRNGIVDAADYVVWRDALGSTTLLSADGDGNDVVDLGDYDVWRMRFGQSAVITSGSAAIASVPEPCGFLLLVAGASTFWRVRSQL
jgi:hypothetical protein